MASTAEIIAELRQQLRENLPGYKLVLQRYTGEVECQGGRMVGVVNTEKKLNQMIIKSRFFRDNDFLRKLEI
jgi:hypothetical protein